MPLELFVLIGSFIEEIISPIPSVVVLTPAGAAAQAQGVGIIHLALLAGISAIGRLAGGIILYFIAHRFEEALLKNRKHFMGISHQTVSRFNQRINREKYGVWVALFLMRAVPIFPGAALSVACGFIHLRLGVFLTTTFIGTTVNAVFFLFIGYAGLQAAQALQSLNYASQGLLILLIVGIASWALRKRFKRR